MSIQKKCIAHQTLIKNDNKEIVISLYIKAKITEPNPKIIGRIIPKILIIEK